MTLIEIAIALPIILVALGMFVQMLAAGSILRKGATEEWAAVCAAQDTVERMRNEEFSEVFKLYNADPFDDPMGPGTAPGHRFEIVGLAPLEGEEFVGEVFLPVIDTGTSVVPVWELREDSNHVRMGTPRDLSGDAMIDDLDHAEDYSLLPIGIEVRWMSGHGPRSVRLETVLTEYR